jgi:alcohol dehydrogenase YqhD (iron-dependent ADH family)
MLNFNYYTPTRLLFGQNRIDNLANVLAEFGKNVLLTYGGGSIKKIGLYDEVLKRLKDFNLFELPGIEPNPKYSQSVVPGVKICKEKKIDVILSVGGGSVLDCSKAIASAVFYDGEPWDILTKKVMPTKALPIVDIITLAATGSEYDNGCVISRPETNDKFGYGNDLLFPKVSILDPRYTFSVSKIQTAAGCADAMNHVFEQYFVAHSTILNDGMMIACLKSLMTNVKKALENPEDYNARAELLYDSSLACNGIFSNGSGPENWPMHAIEHALSAYYDITHGVGLAIITPRWMEYILNDETVDRFYLLGTDLFKFEEKDKFKMAHMVIDEFYKFFKEINIPMTLREVGIDESRLSEMAHHIHINDHLDWTYAFHSLDEEDILNILKKSL